MKRMICNILILVFINSAIGQENRIPATDGGEACSFSQILQTAAVHRAEFTRYDYRYSCRESRISTRQGLTVIAQKGHVGTVKVDEDANLFRVTRRYVTSDFVASDPTLTHAALFPPSGEEMFAMRSLDADYIRWPNLSNVTKKTLGTIGESINYLPFDFKSFGFAFPVDISRKTQWFESLEHYQSWGEPASAVDLHNGCTEYRWGDFDMTVDVSRDCWPIKHTLFSTAAVNGMPVQTVAIDFEMSLVQLGAKWLPSSIRYSSAKAETFLHLEWIDAKHGFTETELDVSAIEKIANGPLISE